MKAKVIVDAVANAVNDQAEEDDRDREWEQADAAEDASSLFGQTETVRRFH